MKKQFLLLFAASALFAACSSDEMPNSNNETNNGQEQTEIENYASSYGVTTEEGVGMSVGAFDEAATKSSDQVIYFDVIPELGNAIKNFEQYVMKADDFAIRVNGDYLPVTPLKDLDQEVVDGATTNEFIITRGQDLKVRVQGLQNLPAYSSTYPYDCTFECYMWLDNKTNLTVNGLLGDTPVDEYVEFFTKEQKMQWIDAESVDSENYKNRGVDSSVDSPADLHDKNNGDNRPEYGYEVRYNVFRGISGRPVGEDGKFDPNALGDTPYIKVSIHANRLADDEPTIVAASIPKK